MTDKKIQTLGLIVRDEQILLGMKKRGFGEGRWNGFGGKVEEGESTRESLAREFREEAGVELIDFEEVGMINFHFADKPIQPEVHIFRIDRYEGEPAESDEMRPQWFSIEEIPYDSMWPSDTKWLPNFLRGERFSGEVHFADDDTIISSQIDIIPEEPREGSLPLS